ncbi:acyltransferase [Neobacillus cucumis]|uniref:acyltransferase family protein n=1 Tax=Neobacillus cucumis TaxID=1740721 RepID=UPI00203B12A5|nr:acyltransferase [Neobacillus cucumis]MCM3729111.1 acyltransferase [Neobacillus cucumis]
MKTAFSLNTIKNDSKASSTLDLLRFLSALVVFLYHFYLPVPGYQAVMVFFVLSGYFISSSVLKTIKQNRWNWSVYLFNRVTRLWIVLLPCLLLTLMWAKLQSGIFGNHEIANHLDIKTFIGNFFFVQDILVDQYGSNGPLWSLSYEFWYYILFPCLILVVYSKKVSMKCLYAFLFVAISFFVGQRIMLYFLIWMLGAMIPLVKPLILKNKIVKNIILWLSVVVSVVLAKYLYILLHLDHPTYEQTGRQYYADFGVGLAFTIMVYLIVSFLNEKKIKRMFNINKYLASFSFTLYLTHYPLLNIVTTWRNSAYWNFNQIETLLLKPTIILSVLLYAIVIASLTEMHTDTIKKFIFKKNSVKITNESVTKAS